MVCVNTYQKGSEGIEMAEASGLVTSEDIGEPTDAQAKPGEHVLAVLLGVVRAHGVEDLIAVDVAGVLVVMAMR